MTEIHHLQDEFGAVTPHTPTATFAITLLLTGRYFGSTRICGVGWVERMKPNRISLDLLGFVPQPNLHLAFIPRIRVDPIFFDIITDKGLKDDLNKYARCGWDCVWWG